MTTSSPSRLYLTILTTMTRYHFTPLNFKKQFSISIRVGSLLAWAKKEPVTVADILWQNIDDVGSTHHWRLLLTFSVASIATTVVIHKMLVEKTMTRAALYAIASTRSTIFPAGKKWLYTLAKIACGRACTWFSFVVVVVGSRTFSFWSHGTKLAKQILSKLEQKRNKYLNVIKKYGINGTYHFCNLFSTNLD